jgi:hypothetical protein
MIVGPLSDDVRVALIAILLKAGLDVGRDEFTLLRPRT